MMDQPHGQQIRRDSAPYSPTATRTGANAAFGGESSPVTGTRLPSQPIPVRNGSQEQSTRGWDSASPSYSASPPPSPDSDGNSAPANTTTPMTDQEIKYDILQYIWQNMDCEDAVDLSTAWERAPKQPPITPESLAELDMPRIINNPKLRHDVNFDRELHFRPNMDGHKGRQKMKSADLYWKALEAELFMYGFAAREKQLPHHAGHQVYWNRISIVSQVRLRKILEAVRDIMKTLVPDSEQGVITERLDVSHLMQEIQNGVCDLIDLSLWLAKILKAHCAPMRDELVDAMQSDIQQGAFMGDNHILVNGLRRLMTILEAMKLDVANHQIRHMRPFLVDDAINFQQRYNAHRISIGKVDVLGARAWLAQEKELLTTATYTPTDLEALTSASLKDILFSIDSRHPQTYYLDVDRIRILRLEMHSTIYRDICLEIFTEMVPPTVPQPALAEASTVLQTNVTAIAGINARFADRVDHIAAEIVRILLTVEGRTPPYDNMMQRMVEHKLRDDFRLASAVFDKHAKSIYQRLLPKLKACIDNHIQRSTLDLHDTLVGNLQPAVILPPMGYGAVLTPVVPAAPQDPDEAFVRRFSHMICLHWHVWRTLVYAPPSGTVFTFPIASTSQRPEIVSPTVPIAQAVYAPGRRWLPVGVTVTEVRTGMPLTPMPVQRYDETPETDRQTSPPPAEPSSDAEPGDTMTDSSTLNPHSQQPA